MRSQGYHTELRVLQQEPEEIEEKGTQPDTDFGIKLRRDEEAAEVDQKAYEASMADARGLFPDSRASRWAQAPRMEAWISIKERLEEVNVSLDNAQRWTNLERKWVARLPGGAYQAKRLAQQDFERHESRLKHWIKLNQLLPDCMKEYVQNRHKTWRKVTTVD